MFGKSYFGHSHFGPTYFGPGEMVVDGGGTTKKDYTEEELKNMESFYGIPFDTNKKETKQEIFDNKVKEIIESDDIGELESIYDSYQDNIEFKENLEILESKAEISQELRYELEETQDISFILSIIEAIE